MPDERKSICVLLNDAIKDEKDAVEMYGELKDLFMEKELLDADSRYKLDAIIEQEKVHREWLERIAQKNRCVLRKERKLWADLPLEERIRQSKALAEMPSTYHAD